MALLALVAYDTNIIGSLPVSSSEHITYPLLRNNNNSYKAIISRNSDIIEIKSGGTEIIGLFQKILIINEMLFLSGKVGNTDISLQIGNQNFDFKSLIYFNSRALYETNLRYLGPPKEIGVGKEEVLFLPKKIKHEKTFGGSWLGGTPSRPHLDHRSGQSLTSVCAYSVLDAQNPWNWCVIRPLLEQN